jgi:hypothetical protein
LSSPAKEAPPSAVRNGPADNSCQRFHAGSSAPADSGELHSPESLCPALTEKTSPVPPRSVLE